MARSDYYFFIIITEYVLSSIEDGMFAHEGVDMYNFL